MTVGVLIEHDGKHMKTSSRHVITAASECQKPIIALVIGYQLDSIAAEVALCDGLDAVWVLDHPDYEYASAERVALWVASLALTHVLASANAFGKNLIPRIAALLNVSPIDGVLSILADKHYVRAMYAGHILCDVISDDLIQCVTITPTAFKSCASLKQAVSIESHASVDLPLLSKRVSMHQADSESPELATAACVMTIGRGVPPELIPRIKRLAKRYKAALGATRAVVDAGLLPNECQVGQTGQVVAPDLYIAWGVSGAVQHLAGMKHSKQIVSINKNPDAPMNAFADFVLEADVVSVLSAWEARFASLEEKCVSQELEYEL